MELFRKKCQHYFTITHVSNILQLDDMGYPMILVIEECSKCGRTKQSWVDVEERALDHEENKILHWRRV